MRPAIWHPSVELTEAEQAIDRRLRKGKLFAFLRRERHRLFSDAFQEELGTIFRDSAFGQPPIPPAQLALATILQAYTGVSDDEVIEATLMDRRWQLVLDCLDCSEAPFSKGTLVAFRQRLIAQDFDRRLIERTIAIAEETGGFGSRQLRGALDSSPLWGAGRVEDTYNLLGHALRKALGGIARQQGRSLAQVAREAGAPMLAGKSLKAALDLNWDDPEERDLGLQCVLDALTSVESWLEEHSGDGIDAVVQESLRTAHQVRQQDVEITSEGRASLRQGVAKERRISVEDPNMRHGRKSRHQRFDGYKRHILRDLDTHLIRAVGVTPANAPEASVTDGVSLDLARQQVTLVELHIDRAYLSSRLVRERSADLRIYCRAWPVHNGGRFPKTLFDLDWEHQRIRCPQGVEQPFKPGQVVHFPAATCATCPKREQCTQSARGRSVSIHADEKLIWELRQQQNTTSGRARLRERVDVEHGLSHVGHWQGPTARYVGTRKNLFDLRRCAVVNNLFVISHLPALAAGSLTT
jgi:hypothetical protein